MIDSCSVPGGDLIAYTDGYLTGGRRELVEAHLRVCTHCQRRLQAFHEVDRILQAAPLVDDPAGRAALRARLEAEARRRRRGGALHRAIVAMLEFVLLHTPVGASRSRSRASLAARLLASRMC